VKDKKTQAGSFSGSQFTGLLTQNFLFPQSEALNWKSDRGGKTLMIKQALHCQSQKSHHLQV
jgi:hypothetical protein